MSVEHPKPIFDMNGDTVYIELDFQLADDFAKYKSIENDLQLIKQWFELLLEKLKEGGSKPNSSDYTILQNSQERIPEKLTMSSLYVSAVITYAKQFAKAYSSRTLRNEVSEIFKNKPEVKKLHLELIEQRNKYHAHADNSNYQELKTIVVFKKEDMNMHELGLLSYDMRHKKLEDIESYLSVVNVVADYTYSKAKKIGDDLLKDEVCPNLDSYFCKAKNNK